MVRRMPAGLVETGPDELSDTLSLKDIIEGSPRHAVHILFVHGIRVGDRGSSSAFRSSLRRRLPGLKPQSAELGHKLALGPCPALTYMGEPIWPDDRAWAGSAPFVDRYVLQRGGGLSPVVVDEVNWWPLALPLRCRAILEPEAELAGPDRDNLMLCAARGKDGQPLNDGIHYPWIDEDRLKKLLACKPALGGAAAANGFVKREIMDWGLSDAVIALGPMRHHLHEAMNQAFAYASERGEPSKFVVVAESLGSFIVFDAYGHAKPGVQNVLDQTAYLYFFANQLALLELGRLADRRVEPAPEAPLSLHQALERWAGRDVATPGLKQIIAFSDPSDALTFRVPPIAGASVVNVYDRNGVDVLRLAADPVAAHTGHSRNPAVLKLMMTHRLGARRGRTDAVAIRTAPV